MKIGLGTAQFGMDYGITNRRGRTSLAEVRAILDTARGAGVDLLDTAAAYGESESVLGNTLCSEDCFRIVSKIPSLAEAEDPVVRAQDAFTTSLARLRRDGIYGLLVHSPDDLFAAYGNALWQLMESLRTAGRIRKLGLSAYTGDEIELALSRFPIDLIQVPCSLVDQRLIAGGQLSELKRRGIEVHARSIFLQGVLLARPAGLPENLAFFARPLAALRGDLDSLGLTPLAAAVAFACHRPEIDRVLVGVTGITELREIIDASEAPVDADFSALALNDERLLNPSLWPAGSGTPQDEWRPDCASNPEAP